MTYEDFKHQYQFPTITYDSYMNGDVTKASTFYDIMDLYRAFDKITVGSHLKHLCCDITTASDETFTPSLSLLSATVRRHEKDSPDSEVAIDEARKKVLKKYHKIRTRHVREILTDIRTLLAHFEHYCEKKNVDITMVPSVEEIKAKDFQPVRAKNND